MKIKTVESLFTGGNKFDQPPQSLDDTQHYTSGLDGSQTCCDITFVVNLNLSNPY